MICNYYLCRMKQFITLLISVLFFFQADTANAQFWKKKNEKKSEQKNKAQQPKPTPASKPEPKAKKQKVDPTYPTVERSNTYRIDLLLPLNLNKYVVNDKVNNSKVSDPAIDFYKGALIAVDSMAKQGFKAELYVHDISNTENSPEQLVQQNKLDNTDLVIGMLQSAEIPAIAQFANDNQVNFISALSPSDAGVTDNPYFILLQPSLAIHVDHMLNYSKNKFSKNPHFLLSRDSSFAEEAARIVSDFFKNNNDFSQINYTDDWDVEALKNRFSSFETNVIYCTILDTRTAYNILKKLSSLGEYYKFEVFGMPTWKGITDLSAAGAYPNVNVYYTTPFYYDINSGPSNELTKAWKTYNPNPNSMPSEYAYRGYELMYWMSNLLDRYGRIFNNHLMDISSTLFTRYEIKPEWDKDNNYLYLENNKLNLLQYINGNLKLAN